MKITSAQLKAIIAEEVKRAARSRLNEESSLQGVGPGGAAFQTGVDECQRDWMDRYSAEDPTMAGYGMDSWEEQVNAACDDLSDGIANLFDEIEAKLIDGGYYAESQPPFGGKYRE